MPATNEPDGNGPRTAEKPPPGARASANEGGLDLREKVDQMGAILAKGLDLAEAGVSLGVTIVNRIGSVAQQQVLERMAAAMQPQAETPTGPPQPMPDAAMGEAAGGPPPETASFYITNRLPLAPGGTLRVSFSINNDSLVTPKKVKLRVEGFHGETTGAVLPAETLAIKPAARTIAPVDFEKFVLQGAVPPETPPDVYFGWILVSSEEELRIPVRLQVSP
ncbi:MAG TPA: hypothetical protein VHA10_25310 [Hypericibacter adhaerens]|jgi:hypothetical protein|uniref:hypothetical protein n=1 Tax=Hypericibacter adhaerens TaxID=2602016 RepID=UPI002B5C873A|nr:hypothetical protein [Hypericibacter adhaerens]HWA46562.1 hypothetical protein [Hypericibacter adhaerens]